MGGADFVNIELSALQYQRTDGIAALAAVAATTMIEFITIVRVAVVVTAVAGKVSTIRHHYMNAITAQLAVDAVADAVASTASITATTAPVVSQFCGR